MTNRTLLALLLPLSVAACADESKDDGASDGADGASDGADGASDGADGAPTNAPPTTATVAISPERPSTDEDATVVIVAAASDPDGDALSYRYVWFQDGVLRADLTTDTLPATETAKGEVWTVSVVANDGLADGGVAEAEATVVNTPPTASISLPASVNTEVELGATVEGLDADGDAVTLALSWTVDGAPTALTSTSVPAGETRRGQVWALTATPSDDDGEGAPVTAEVLIENGVPTVASVELGPNPAFEGTELRATVVGAADMDGDAVLLAFSWTVNGSPVGASGDSLSGALYFDKGDVVQVTVTPLDGLGLGESRISAALTVQNMPPTAPVVAIAPEVAVTGEALVCAVLTDATDDDRDALSYTFAWAVDGAPYVGAGESVYTGDTVVVGETLAEEVWSCTVVADDGSAFGSPAEDEVLVESACGDGRVTLTASGIEFVTVCGGTFTMGCTPGQESCEADETPVRSTTLTHNYYMGRTEVTQDQFAAVMGYNSSAFSGSCGSTDPVEQVSWHEAAAFANGVSAAEGLAQCYICTGSGTSVTCSPPSSVYSCAGYRLPTEADDHTQRFTTT